jgi:hypothetical protein
MGIGAGADSGAQPTSRPTPHFPIRCNKTRIQRTPVPLREHR